MANTVADYCLKIHTEGSKASIEAFEKVIAAGKKMQDMDKKGTAQTEKQTKAITKESSALWLLAKRLLGVYSVYALFKKGLNLGLNFAEQGNMIANLATTANVSTKSLQKWGYALKKYGGSEQSIAGTMSSLQQRLFEYQQWGNANAFAEFMKLGGQVPTGSTPEQFLLSLAQQLKKMPRDRALAMANSLGLDAATTRFLVEGDVQKELANAKVLYTDGDIARAKAAKEQLIAFNHEMKKLGNLMAIKLLPLITAIVKGLTQFVDKINSSDKPLFETLFGKLGKPIDYLLSDSNDAKSYFNREDKTPKTKKEANKDIAFKDTILGSGLSYLKANFDRLFPIMPSLTPFAPFSALGNAINNTLNQANNITINGASAPELVAQAVVGSTVGFANAGFSRAIFGFESKEK